MLTSKTQLIGPFKQILTFQNLPMKGKIIDEQLEIIENGGIVVSDGKIKSIGIFEDLQKDYLDVNFIDSEQVLMPSFIDAHTHICYGGSRANDYAMRIAGTSYLEIAKAGGGILSSVRRTREASHEDLLSSMIERVQKLIRDGITTCEVKSGYGLSKDAEIKMLEVIREANQKVDIELISTCLAAHTRPREFSDNTTYLNFILTDILPKVINEKLSKRIDVFVEDSAFKVKEAKLFLIEAQKLGFDITVHADQFTTGGSALSIELGAISADHLEASTAREIELLAKSETVATVLPGASLGLGMDFAPARKLLDAGACLSIASDWNPGSAPMGDLLTQASILSAKEKLSTAETFAGITFRAAKALNLLDRGRLVTGMLADMISFTCGDYREILYHQGKLKPKNVWKSGNKVL